MIAATVIEQVRQVPLVSFISQYVKLKRNGKSYVGSCPFHDENTPSFNVRSDKYTCFGCGASGSNAIDFLMAYEKLSFADAVERVAALCNILMDANHTGNIQQPARTLPAKPKTPATPPITIIPESSVKRFQDAYDRSFLFSFFVSRYGTQKADAIFKMYGVGACSLYNEFAENTTTLFIQRDIHGRVRQMGAVPYDPESGKRRKEKNLKPKRIGLPHLKRMGMNEDDINLVQCFFGEHLLQGNSKPVNIVESEKTAMIASLHYPQYIWLATGGNFGVGLPRPETWGVLKGRQVMMFPDTDKRLEWIDQAAMLEEITGEDVHFIDIMNGNPVPQGMEKYDLADLILDAAAVPAVPRAPYEVTAPCTFHIGNVYYFPEPEFKGLTLQSFYLSDGRILDCLISADESFVSEKSTVVSEIEKQYNKRFAQGSMYGYAALLHSLN